MANVEKKLPRNYISKDGFHITDACRRYLSPLIAGEDYPPYKNGLPQYVTLKNVGVAKKLGERLENVGGSVTEISKGAMPVT